MVRSERAGKVWIELEPLRRRARALRKDQRQRREGGEERERERGGETAQVSLRHTHTVIHLGQR